MQMRVMKKEESVSCDLEPTRGEQRLTVKINFARLNQTQHIYRMIKSLRIKHIKQGPTLVLYIGCCMDTFTFHSNRQADEEIKYYAAQRCGTCSNAYSRSEQGKLGL